MLDDALKVEPGEPVFAAVGRMKPQPGDVVVMYLVGGEPADLRETAEVIKKQWGVEVLMLPAGDVVIDRWRSGAIARWAAEIDGAAGRCAQALSMNAVREEVEAIKAATARIRIAARHAPPPIVGPSAQADEAEQALADFVGHFRDGSALDVLMRHDHAEKVWRLVLASTATTLGQGITPAQTVGDALARLRGLAAWLRPLVGRAGSFDVAGPLGALVLAMEEQ